MKHQDYTIGWICALPTEMAAAVGMLDSRHDPLPQPPHDDNIYTLGCIGAHNVAIACLPAGVTGNSSAAIVATRMLLTFTSMRFGLMVGIGGGVPSQENDIRLGDVVVSKPGGTSGGVIQYDFGKTVQAGRFVRTGSLNKPPDVLLNAVASLQAKHMMEDPKFSKYLLEIISKYPKLRDTVKYQGAEHDVLFTAEYDHHEGDIGCVRCDVGRSISRYTRNGTDPAIHYGLIASGNQVMRDGLYRERLRKELNVLCFEMEAAGLMDNFPCLVIRGICDYADSHKNKRWQAYAAATAAAYAKELLYIIPQSRVIETPSVFDEIKVDQAKVSIQGYVPPPTLNSATPSPPTPPALPPRPPSNGGSSYPDPHSTESVQKVVGFLYTPAEQDTRSIQLAELKNTGLWDEAQRLEHETFQDKLRTLGAEHLSTLTTGYDLACTFLELGLLKDAANWSSWVSSTNKPTLDSKHALLSMNVESLRGEILLEQGHFQEGETICATVLAKQQDSLGNDNLNTLETQRRLAFAWHALGRNKDAITRLQKRTNDLVRIVGERHICFIASVLDWVEVMIRSPLDDPFGVARFSNEVQLASKVMGPVSKDLRDSLGPKNPVSIRALRICGTIKLQEGEVTEASDILRRSLLNAEETLGSDHPGTLDIVAMLGVLYIKQNSPSFQPNSSTEMRPWFQRYLEWLEKRKGSNHRETLYVLSLLGMSYMGTNDYIEAEKYFERLSIGYGGQNSKEAQTANQMLELCRANAMLIKRQNRNNGSDVSSIFSALGLR